MGPAHLLVAINMCGKTKMNESISVISHEAKFSSSFYSVCCCQVIVKKNTRVLLVHSSTA